MRRDNLVVHERYSLTAATWHLAAISPKISIFRVPVHQVYDLRAVLLVVLTFGKKTQKDLFVALPPSSL